jgi:outer membrane protein TolC
MSTAKGILTIVPAALAAWLGGCVNPGEIDHMIWSRYQQEMARRSPQPRTGPDGLRMLQPVAGFTGPELKLQTAKDPNGKTTTQAFLSLDEAVMRTLANGLDIRVLSYDPDISREEMMKAAAAFDAIVFGGYSFRRDDRLTANTNSGVLQPTQPEVNNLQAGLKQHTVTGADWSLAWSMTRTVDDSSVSQLSKWFDAQMTLQLTQPLLRNAWPEYNLSRLEIANLSMRIADAQFRAKVEQTVDDAVNAYWGLWLARQEVEVLERVLKDGIEILEIVRQQRDTGTASLLQVEQVETTVKAREAALVHARKAVGDQRDKLARLMADAQLNVVSDCDIVPVTPPLEEAIKVDGTDQLLTALRCNPLLEQARLAIRLADVNVSVAENQLLPKLDLTASAGLMPSAMTRDRVNDAFWSGNYFSYAVGLTLEYPLGNRAALADVRRSDLVRRKSVVDMQNVADQLALAIRERVRQIVSSYDELLVQKESAKVARSYVDKWRIRVSRETGENMRPERLAIVLQAQDGEAQAQRLVLAATVSYNTAIADLARVAGTTLDLHRIKIAAVADRTGWPVPPVRIPPPSTSSAPSRPTSGTEN